MPPSESAASLADASSKSSALSLPAKRPLLSKLSPKHRRPAAWRHSSTPNTRSILFTPKSSASIPTFSSSIRVDIRRIAAIKEGDLVVGSRTKVKIVKNKTAAPFREAEFDIMYGEGISREGDMLDLAAIHNIVEKSGSWFSYKGERIGQGRENAKQFLNDNKDIASKIEQDVRRALGLTAAPGP